MKILLFTILLVLVTSKVTNVTIQFTKKDAARWTYLGKFAMGIGTGSWSVQAKFPNPIDKTADDEESIDLKLGIYIDENWQMVLDDET